VREQENIYSNKLEETILGQGCYNDFVPSSCVMIRAGVDVGHVSESRVSQHHIGC